MELEPGKKIVQSIRFETIDPNLFDEMIMEVTLEGKEQNTLVTIIFKNIPPGIKAEDNEAGTASLEKLARYAAQSED